MNKKYFANAAVAKTQCLTQSYLSGRARVCPTEMQCFFAESEKLYLFLKSVYIRHQQEEHFPGVVGKFDLKISVLAI